MAPINFIAVQLLWSKTRSERHLQRQTADQAGVESNFKDDDLLTEHVKRLKRPAFALINSRISSKTTDVKGGWEEKEGRERGEFPEKARENDGPVNTAFLRHTSCSIARRTLVRVIMTGFLARTGDSVFRILGTLYEHAKGFQGAADRSY